MKLIVDAFGGDNAPLEIIKGCLLAKEELGVEILLVGNKEIVQDCAAKNGLSLQGLELLHAETQLTMEDDPTAVVKHKRDCSMAVGFRALSEGKGDAFASAGNSGGLVVGSTMIVRRIKGIKRVTFASLIPKENGFFMLSDAGANTECRPEMLEQFGLMGAVYMEKVMGIQNPRVGLLNVGTEAHKGTALQHEAYVRLQNNARLNFVGNVEGRDMPRDGADVLVCDGFTGNVALKVYEGVAGVLMGKIKGIFKKSLLTKIAAAIVLKDMKALKNQMDYNEYGGAPIMGAAKPVFKIHGSAKAHTVKNALALTKRYVESGIIEAITVAVKEEVTHDESANGTTN